MRFLWIFVCVVALSACKSETVEPEPTATPEEAAPTAPSEEPAAAEEALAEQAAAPEAAAPPAVAPDPNAPSDVAAAPKDAKRSKSGLAWKRLRKGKGKAHPDKYDTVTLSYTGWTPDGRQFDSSTAHGEELSVRVNHLIPGLAEGLRMMVPGEKRRLWIPAKLGYGEVGANVDAAPRQPSGDLVFDLELVRFEKAPTPPTAPKDVGAIPADAAHSESGLAWRVVEAGTGTDHPLDTSMVEVSYTLWTADGEVVDSSVFRNGRDTLGVMRLIPGWSEGMKLMVEGERRVFWIPEDLAFQGAPHRPAGMLVVDVKFHRIRRDIHQVR
jgi:FKBP-type peptidyl-prolyl cis-trans isomerase